MLTRIGYEQLKDGIKAKDYEGNIRQFTKDELPLDDSTIIIEKYFAAKLSPFDLRPTIQKVDFPSGIQEIGKKAFFGNSIKEVILPDKCEFLMDEAFRDNEISSLNLNKCKYIGNCCFTNNQIKTLIIPNTVEHIGKEAFKHNCIKEIYISDNIKHLGEGVFVYNNIQRIYISTTFAKKFSSFVDSYKEITKVISPEYLIKDLSSEKSFKEINEIFKVWKI